MSQRIEHGSERCGAVVRSQSARIAWVALAASVFGGACVVGPPPPVAQPFVVPKAEFYDSVETIVATPVLMPEGVEASDSVLTWFDDLIERTLREAGFTVVPAETYMEMWNRINQEAGGFFDPLTGERDEPRYQAAVDQLFDELKERFSPDAILYPEMWIVEAPTSGGYARWDGTTQRVGTQMESAVLALSLAIVVQDMDAAELYSNVWGLEVLELYNWNLGDFTEVPSGALFADQGRNTTAVMKTLGPLIERSPKHAEATPTGRPLNLGFERLSVDGSARPWGWSAMRTPATIELQLDSTIYWEGARSLRVSRAATGADSSAHDILRLHIPARFAWGRQVMLRGWVRSANATGGGRLRLEVWQPGKVIAADSSAVWLEGSLPWTPSELSVSVDSSAMYVVVIPEFRGTGTVWFDDLEITADGVRYDAVPVAATPGEADIAWLARHTTTIETVDAPSDADANYADLAPFAEFVGDARVVALGEDTHGTSEFFRAKHRLTRFMGERMGARVFAIEANQLAVRPIDDYVLGAAQDVHEVMRGMFRVWNTEEMLELIEWMRQHNAAHPDQLVHFVGYDMQDPSLPIDSVIAFLSRTDPALEREVRPLYEDYREAWRSTPYPVAPDSVRASWKRGADSAWNMVTRGVDTWLAAATGATDTADIEWAVQNANVIRQAALSAVTQRLADRDSAMAVNLEWILGRYPADSRVVIWAHNAHVARGTDPERSFYQGGSMGGYLGRLLGDDLRVVGLVSYDGQYTATASFSDRREVTVDAFPAPVGTVEQALHQIAQERTAQYLFADLRPARNDPEAAWLRELRPTRLIGYAALDFDWETMVVLPHVFDALLFVDHATGSHLLPRQAGN
jgi:erythromycin esterase